MLPCTHRDVAVVVRYGRWLPLKWEIKLGTVENGKTTHKRTHTHTCMHLMYIHRSAHTRTPENKQIHTKWNNRFNFECWCDIWAAGSISESRRDFGVDSTLSVWVQWFGCIFQWTKSESNCLLPCFAFMWIRSRARTYTHHIYCTHGERILASRAAKSFEDETIQTQTRTRTHIPHNSAVRRESCKLRNSNSELKPKLKLSLKSSLSSLGVLCAMWCSCFVSTK